MKKQKPKTKKTEATRKIKKKQVRITKRKLAKSGTKKQTVKSIIKNSSPANFKNRKTIDLSYDSLSNEESFNPLAGVVAETPVPSPEFYVEELLIWLLDKPVSGKSYGTPEGVDYALEHSSFPPEVFFGNPMPEIDNKRLTVFEDFGSMETVMHGIPESSFKRMFRLTPGGPFLVGMLDLTKTQPRFLVGEFAKRKNIETYFIDGKEEGEIKCIEILEEVIKPFLNATEAQLIPVLYHGRRHGHLMSHDNRTCTMDAVTSEHTYEFGFTRETSNLLAIQLLNILRERKQFLLNFTNKTPIEENQPIDSKNVGKMNLSYIKQNKTELEISRAEWALLFDFMRNEKMILAHIPKEAVGRITHYLTGVNAEKMRQFLSNGSLTKPGNLHLKDLQSLHGKIKGILKQIEKEIEATSTK